MITLQELKEIIEKTQELSPDSEVTKKVLGILWLQIENLMLTPKK